ncbi:hypothetical protein J5N52_04700 [Acinetobacter soli]|uniref:hypothetical protein n=1 Tax=Acinetobacter soli TaxID=487316 RepID=UPI001ABC2878|nr:hypothetical protein [Acinetobacter soli]MBO3671323.1 hypothetical protein [Acinetobacter soli]
MSVTIKSNVKATANLKYAVRDNLLKVFATNSNNVDGIFLFSLDDVNCFAKQASPVVDDTVLNLADGTSKLTYRTITSNGSVSFDSVTRSLDFSALNVGLSGFSTPANWLANEFNGQNKYFIMTAYVFIPEAANWHAKSGGLVDFAGTITSADSAQQTEILGAIAFIHHPSDAAEYQIWGRYSTSANPSGAYTGLQLTSVANNANFPFGKWAQISLVRSAAGSYLLINSSLGKLKTTVLTDTSGKDVVEQYGGRLNFGRGKAYPNTLTNKYKLSRGFIINLNKNPVSDIDAFLKADFDRQVARGFIS